MDRHQDHDAPQRSPESGGIRSWFAGLSPRWRKGIKYGIGGVLGAAAGFGVYSATGCDTGGCSLSRDPYVSVMIGTVMGMLVADGRRSSL